MRRGRTPHGVRLLDADLAPGCYAELTSDHHLLTRREPLVDDDEVLLPLPECHGPQCRGGILLNNVDEGALGRGLQRRRRDEYRSLAHAQDEADLGELARPEMTIAVGDRGTEVHRARGVLHGVVKECEFPGMRRAGLIGQAYFHRQAAPRHVLPYRRDVV